MCCWNKKKKITCYYYLGRTTNANSSLESICFILIKKKYLIIIGESTNSSKHPQNFSHLCPAQFPLERTNPGTIYFTFQGLFHLASWYLICLWHCWIFLKLSDIGFHDTTLLTFPQSSCFYCWVFLLCPNYGLFSTNYKPYLLQCFSVSQWGYRWHFGWDKVLCTIALHILG